MASKTYTAQLSVAYQEYIDVIINSTKNDESNTSTVSYAVNFRVVGAGNYYQYNYGNRLLVQIAGTTFVDSANVCGIQLSGDGATKTIASGSFTFNHNSDGSGSFPVYVYFDQTQKDGYTATVSETFTCDTIPRATTPTLSASSCDLMSAVTINLPRASAAFTHTLSYVFGNASDTIVTGAATSASWTPPASLASQIPSAGSGLCTIYCATYSGSTLIGTKYVQITLTVPDTDTFKPVVSKVDLAEAGDVPADWGIYVQSKSKLQVTTTAVGQYGAAINSVTVTVQDTQYSGNPITSGYLTKSGDLTVKVKVVDSRSKATEYSKTINALAYQAPSISEFSAERCNSAGTVDGESAYALLTMKFSVAELAGKNSATYEVDYKLEDGASWSSLVSGSSYVYDGTKVTGAVFDVTKIYHVRLTVADSFGEAYSVHTIPTAAIIMHIRGDGTGVSFGEYSQGPGVRVNMDIEHKKAVMQPLIDAETDWDTILTPNTYAALNATTAGYTHCPFTDRSSTLEVFSANTDDSIIQRATGCTKNETLVYERIYYDGTWGDWVRTSGADIVVEQGISGIWTYRKWASGVAECWGVTDAISADVSQSWGSLYYGIISEQQAYPFAFIGDPPVVLASQKAISYDWLLCTYLQGETTKSPSYYAIRPSSATVTGAVYIHAIGKWK